VGPFVTAGRTSLPSGTRLGPYEILAPLGAGGMGEVYRARDTRLDRTVAIKVLPSHLASNADLRQRFEREARAVSSLNHPHICTLHDIGHQDGIDYLVLEYLEGKSLLDRLEKGPLPLDQALRYATEIADALDKSHRNGVIHRDLKPGNVMLTKTGAKLLDFGLARTAKPIFSNEDELSALATRARPLTGKGTLLGTVPYMAPEQIEGREADARTDLWAFGALLYEMVTGKRAFAANSPASLIGAILKDEPRPMRELKPLTPPSLERLVKTCLAKDPDERWQNAHDLAAELRWIAGGGAAAPGAARPGARLRSRLLLGAAFLAAGILIGSVLDRWFRLPAAPPGAVFRTLTYSGHDTSPAASPDGRTIAFSSDRDGRPRIWLKELAGGGEAVITSGPDDFPRFSPDGSQLLFTRSEGGTVSLYRVPLLGGEPRKLVGDVVAGDWSPDGRQIAFVRWVGRTPIVSIFGVAAADGGAAHEVGRVEAQALSHPRWSPDGRSIAASIARGSGFAGPTHSFFIASASGGPVRSFAAPQKVRRDVSSVAWSGPDEVVYTQALSVSIAAGGAGSIIRQDVRTGEIRARFWSPNSSQVFALLGPGRAVFDARSARQNLREIPLEGGAARWLTRGNGTDRQPVYAPDGEWVLFSSIRGGGMDVWAVSTKSGALRRLTDDEANDWDPALTADGKKLLWTSDRTGHFEIWMAEADGSGARQVSNDGVDAEDPVATPDGRWIVYVSRNQEKLGLWRVRPDGTEASRIVPNGNRAEISPDGQYILYRIPFGNRVCRLDGTAVPFEISVESRRSTPVVLGRARWMPDGRRIAFVGQNENGENGIFLQDFVPGKDTSGTRRPLGGFDPEASAESFAISPDGSRMVVAGWEQLFSIMTAEGLEGIAPPGGERR
jgi:Tol biopolymer transport system component